MDVRKSGSGMNRQSVRASSTRPLSGVVPFRRARPEAKLPAARRDNILRAVRFERPAYIPMVFHINQACWHTYPAEALKELIASHPVLFPVRDDRSPGRTELDYVVIERPGKPFIDGWGCVWETTMEGMVGSVTKHPLADWSDFNEFEAPDPVIDSGKGPVDWKQIATDIARARSAGHLTVGGLRHGYLLQTLADIRGYENLMFDMADNHPSLPRLIEIVEHFNMAIVQRYLDVGVEWMCYPEDLGMQTGPMISPALFRKFVKPSYERLMKPARAAGSVIHIHSDGRVCDLLDDLIHGGVNVINLQDLVNGIDWIKDKLAGKVCIDLDIDRQHITASGTSKQIDALIKEEVIKLGSKEGGLMMIYGLYPGVPLENVKALMDAMECYAGFYS